MREIKFRAWDIVNEEMHDLWGFYYFDDETEPPDSIWVKMVRLIGDTIDESRPVGTMELREYTGLKDKNGVEIYEGDVVRDIPSEGESYPLVNGPFLIEHRYGMFCFDAKRRDYLNEPDLIGFGWWVRSNDNKNTLKQLEVIGNIYQNGDLLSD